MNFNIISHENKNYIIVPRLLELGLKHCFTTRDMDMGIMTNGSIKDIKENFMAIYSFLDIKPKILFSGLQTHSANIVTINDISQGETNDFGKFFSDTDGLITDKENIALISRYADCSPIILYDPIKKIQGNIHSGWRGTLQRIGSNGVDIMVREYNSNPEDIIAVIGPTIGKDDFEVDIDVKVQFEEKFGFHKEIISKKNDVKYLIDLQTTNKRILLSKGIKEENIITINLSTFSEHWLHSYRRDRDKFGLMGLVTCL